MIAALEVGGQYVGDVDGELLTHQYDTLSSMFERRAMDWTPDEQDAVQSILSLLERIERAS